MKKIKLCLGATLAFMMMITSACSDQNSNGLIAQNNNSGLSNTAGSISLGAHASDVECSRIALGSNGDMNGFVPLPSDNAWNRIISGLPAAANSDALITNYINQAGDSALQGDFGNEYGEDYNVVDSSIQTTQTFNITLYPTESDIMPVPISNSALVEGSEGGDRHLFILDRNTCWLYETWGTNFDGIKWNASNMAVWDLLKTSERPYLWTSADAAGLAIFPGLFRYDEVARGEIKHAIRFTLKSSADGFVPPATHSAGYNSNSFPMGTRFRLKDSFDISKLSAADQVILTAMKKYGLILADNGLDFEIAGTHDARWNETDVGALRAVHFSDMEVMSPDSVETKAAPVLPSGEPPQIISFSSSEASINAGQAVTLTWETSNDSWDFIDVIGPIRGNFVTVVPNVTTTYTLNATNIHGRTTESITVIVQ